MEFIDQFFLKRIDELNIPRGHHIIRKTVDNDILTIILECDSLDLTINKLIKLINNDNFYFYVYPIITLLSKEYPLFNFSYVNLTNTKVKVDIRIKIWVLYLNFNRIPPDIFQVIIPYLDLKDYEKLMNILRLQDYPDLGYRLSKFSKDQRYFINSNGSLMVDDGMGSSPSILL